MMSGGTLFEELGYYYVGPVDGHDLDNLVPILENIRDKKDDKPVSVLFSFFDGVCTCMYDSFPSRDYGRFRRRPRRLVGVSTRVSARESLRK